jgi:hypothetical protein
MFRKLPGDVQKQAYAAYQLFKHDPHHPSLQFKRIEGRLYSARVGISCRVLGERTEDDLVVWGWIGSHADYDKLI